MVILVSYPIQNSKRLVRGFLSRPGVIMELKTQGAFHDANSSKSDLRAVTSF